MGALLAAGGTASVVPPIGDLVLLGIIARLLVTAATRSASIWLLSGGVVVCAVADACAGLWRLGAVPWFGTFAGQTLMAAGWMGCCLLWGAAALVPSMRDNTEPAHGTGSDVLPARIAALTALALVVPVVAFVQQVREHSQGGRLGLVLGGLDESPRQLAVVEGIIGIGRALGLTIIAEGIETEEQYRRLRDLGADRGQGRLFGKPMPRDDADGLVRAGQG